MSSQAVAKIAGLRQKSIRPDQCRRCDLEACFRLTEPSFLPRPYILDEEQLLAGEQPASEPGLAPATKKPLDAQQAARAVYPAIARSLQKFLRLTRQTGRHNLQSIYEHLAKCLLYKLSAQAFIEKFVNQDPVWQQSETSLFAGCRLDSGSGGGGGGGSAGLELELNSWSLVCDTLLSRQVNSGKFIVVHGRHNHHHILHSRRRCERNAHANLSPSLSLSPLLTWPLQHSGTFFVLKQGQVSLLVSVARLPHLSLSEELVDFKSAKYKLEPNSESSV